MMLKRIISILSALVLACGLFLPVIAENGVLEMQLYTIYNPISHGNKVDSEKPLSGETVRVNYATTPAFDSLEEGAEYLCQRLKERDPEVRFTVNNVEGFSSLSTDDKKSFTAGLGFYSMTHTGDPKAGDYLLGQWSQLSYGFTDLGTGGVTFNYKYTFYADAEQEAELDVKLKEVLDELDVYDASDYEKSNAVYDYLCENITYDYENLEDEEYMLKYSAYAGLINGTCVCNGYAVLYYRMMMELGVDARYITGIGNGGAHAWNIVRLDGWYYNLDATWDAGMPYYNFYLVPDDLFFDHEREYPYNGVDFYDVYPMDYDVYTPGVKDYVDYENGFTYYPLSDDSGYMLVSISGLDREDIDIPETFNGKPVIAIMNHVFLNGKNLKEITIPQSVEYIFEYAFTGCDNLETVNYVGEAEDWENMYRSGTWVYSYPMPVYEVEFLEKEVLGDINGDGSFTYTDVTKLYAVYREISEAEGVDLDINGDGNFSYADITKLYAIYRGVADFVTNN